VLFPPPLSLPPFVTPRLGRAGPVAALAGGIVFGALAALLAMAAVALSKPAAAASAGGGLGLSGSWGME
jgi:hypothetical protein